MIGKVADIIAEANNSYAGGRSNWRHDTSDVSPWDERPECEECGEKIEPPDEVCSGGTMFHRWCFEVVEKEMAEQDAVALLKSLGYNVRK